jgi:hypothetical protein
MFPFLRYASQYVLYHAEKEATMIPQHRFLVEFSHAAWVQASDFLAQEPDCCFDPRTSLLHILAENNFAKLIRTIYHGGPVLGERGGPYQYPLYAAVNVRHRGAIRALLHLSDDASFPVPTSYTGDSPLFGLT